MANLMQMSANEMKFLIKHSVKSLGFSLSDQINAGSRAAACYQYDLADSQLIAAALDHLCIDVQAPVLVRQDVYECCFDANGQSALIQIELALGVGLASNAKQIRVTNTSEGIFAAPVLMEWLSQPMSKGHANQSVTVYFMHTNGTQRCLQLDANGQFLGLYQPCQQIVANNEILVRVGIKNLDSLLIASASDLIGWRVRSLDEGILVDLDLVTRLRMMMQNSCVPESDISRSGGAGPD
jgi:hypothetical protein